MGNGNRGTNPNSIKNLEKGRTKGKGRPIGTGGSSWQDIVNMFLGMNPTDSRLIELAGLSQEDSAAFCKAVGVKKLNYKMLVTARAVRLFLLDGNAAILRELMQRSEPLTETSPVTVNNIIRVREIVNDENK